MQTYISFLFDKKLKLNDNLHIMMKGLLSKLKESFLAVFPISAIVFFLAMVIVPTTSIDKINLVIGFILLVLGLSLFTQGADMSMIQIGQSVGGSLYRTKKIWIMLIASALIGFVITFAEPDLQLFAMQVAEHYNGITSTTIIMLIISLGTGIYLLLSIIKTLFKLKLSTILTFSYILIITIAFFVPESLMSFALDSGSVTTGPISVPFLIAFGLGFSSARSSNTSEEDSFGMLALCSVGPVLASMIFCLFVKNAGVTIASSEKILNLGENFVKYLSEIAITILPILIIFFIFQFSILKLPKKHVKKILLGILYTYIGIVLFLAGINSGYLSLGVKIGEFISTKNTYWLYLISVLLGFGCVIAEPALVILKKQISDITGGVIKQKSITITVGIGVALSVLFAVIKTLYEIPILYFYIPVLIVALILCFINSSLFTGIAFDSGGVATGTLAVSFILPFVNGIALGLGKSVSGFGTVALIALFPILSIQVLGFIYKLKVKKLRPIVKDSANKVEIIEFEWEV